MVIPEFELLRLAVRSNDRDASVKDAVSLLEHNKIDWDRLYERATFHSLRPQLARLMHEISDAAVPCGFKERLDVAYQNNLIDQLANVAEFFRVKDILERSGISAVPFKGFWLAHEMYGNIADRESIDVDLFIDINDLEKISGLMPEAGYIPEVFFSPLTLPEIRLKCGEYNFDRFEDGRRKFHFEFQWRITSPVYGLGINFSDLQSQIIRGYLQERELMVFSPSASLLLAVLHHGGKDSFISMRQALDIAMILRRYRDLDWEWILSKAEKYHAGRLIPVALKLAANLTGSEIPSVMRDKVIDHRVTSLAWNRMLRMSEMYGQQKNFRAGLNDWLFRVRTRSGLRTKMRLLTYIGGIMTRKYLGLSMHTI